MLDDILLAGCGKMGSALLKGWLDHTVAQKITVLDPETVPGGLAENQTVSHVTSPEGLRGLKPDVLVLAVKPQIIDQVCRGLATFLSPDTAVVSIAAGTPIALFEQYFGKDRPVIRTMPNTPAAIGKGAIVAVTNENCTEKDKQAVQSLMEVCGTLDWIEDEKLMDAVTALSGSGPAYVFYLIEVLAKAGQKAGLDKNLAQKLARQTVIGAAALAEQMPQETAVKLRENVTSPGGTTEAALEILMNSEIQTLFDQTLKAAKNRSKELSGTS